MYYSASILRQIQVTHWRHWNGDNTTVSAAADPSHSAVTKKKKAEEWGVGAEKPSRITKGYRLASRPF